MKPPGFPPKDGKRPSWGAAGIGATEGAQPGLGLGMMPGRAPFILQVPGAGAGLWQQPEAGGGTQGWSVTASKAGDDGGEIWGEQQLPAGRVGSCWGQAGCQDGGCRRQTGRELSVQGVVVLLGGSLAPRACGSPPCDDGKCLGTLRCSRMGSGSSSFRALLMPLVLELWGRMVFPCSLSLGGFNSRGKPQTHLPLVQPPMPLEPLWGICATVPRFLWDPRFWGCGELSSDEQCWEGR